MSSPDSYLLILLAVVLPLPGSLLGDFSLFWPARWFVATPAALFIRWYPSLPSLLPWDGEEGLSPTGSRFLENVAIHRHCQDCVEEVMDNGAIEESPKKGRRLQ